MKTFYFYTNKQDNEVIETKKPRRNYFESFQSDLYFNDNGNILFLLDENYEDMFETKYLIHIKYLDGWRLKSIDAEEFFTRLSKHYNLEDIKHPEVEAWLTMNKLSLI